MGRSAAGETNRADSKRAADAAARDEAERTARNTIGAKPDAGRADTEADPTTEGDLAESDAIGAESNTRCADTEAKRTTKARTTSKHTADTRADADTTNSTSAAAAWPMDLARSDVERS